MSRWCHRFVQCSLAIFTSSLLLSCSAGGDGATPPPPQQTTGSTTLTVTTTVPIDGAVNVSPTSAITTTFSQPIDAATFTTTTVSISPHADGILTVAGATAMFTPSPIPLLPRTTYTVTLTTAIKDTNNHPLASTRAWTFTTGNVPDTAAPVLSATSPVNGLTNVPIASMITAMFSEPIDPASVNTGTFVFNPPAIGNLDVNGPTVTFTPALSSPLAGLTLYTVTLTTGIKDLAGNHLAVNRTWTFTTGVVPDVTPPQVSATSPANTAAGVPITSAVTAMFSEPIDPASVNTGTFVFNPPAIGNLDVNGPTVTFTPALSSPFAGLTLYTVTLTTGIKDLAGNPLASDRTWDFTTGALPDTIPPQVSASTPTNGAANVPVNTAITATFTETMTCSTINAATFSLKDNAGGSIPGTVACGGATATFTPNAPLNYLTLYIATVTTGAKDLAGNGLVTPYTWNFTTGIAPDTTPPTVLGTIPASGAAGISFLPAITVTFSEPIKSASVTAASFIVSPPVAGNLAVIGSTATFTPSTALAGLTTYAVMLTTAIQDQAGNAIVSPYSWAFTTRPVPDTTPPTVTATSPVNGVSSVPITSAITVTFSEAIDAQTVNNSTFSLSPFVSGTVVASGTTATFTPSSPLSGLTLYTATLTTGVTDLAGNHLPINRAWTFTTGAVPDTTPPTVSMTSPANGATGVPIFSSITATFSEQIQSASVNAGTFTLTPPATGTVTGTGATATFTPAAPLFGLTPYTATLTTGIKDLAGNPLASANAWTFTTGAVPDTTPPTVTTTTPAPGLTGVSISTSITATFSEPIDPNSVNTGTFFLTPSVTGNLTVTDTTVTFKPSAPLSGFTSYTATITTGVRDLAGNALATARIWAFTTGAIPDTSPPTVTATMPLNNAVDVSVNAAVTATFSEAIAMGTINTATFILKDSANNLVAGSVNYSGLTATFTPTAQLTGSTQYSAALTTGIQDLAGNALATNRVWTFTTGAVPDTIAPTVLSTNPTGGDTGVSATSTITATFSEPIKSTTVNAATFRLNPPATGNIGAIGTTATFAPSSLLPNTIYTATLTTGITDLAGNPLTSNRVWTFTTGSAPDTVPPSVNTTSPLNGTVGVAVSSILTATFSEPIDTSTVSGNTVTLTPPVIANITASGSTVTIAPVSLLGTTTYTVTFTTGIKDLAGNALGSPYSFVFTTGLAPDIIPPIVLTTNPTDGAVGVPLSSNIAATFSEPVASSTVTTTTFKFNPPVSGTVAVNGATATFAPSSLAADTTYTVTLTTGITDITGNHLISDVMWVFTTISAPVPETGLDFPGSAAVPTNQTMRFRFMNPQNNGLPIYGPPGGTGVTYIWRAYPRQQSGYYTAFFWGNDNGKDFNENFLWNNGSSDTFYGAHPYPDTQPNGSTHQWEIAAQGNDFVNGVVVYNRWYTQALRVWADGTGKHHEFYWDLPNTDASHRVIVDLPTSYGNLNPPVPALTWGDAPWNPSAEVWNGVLRGIQIYSSKLSLADIQSEIASPRSTSDGAANVWYLNVNPTPTDISDKSGRGHNPSWVGGLRPSLYTKP